MSVLDFEIDDPLAEFKFSDRLANENMWDKKYTKRCIEEYKKFMFLAEYYKCVTPSVAVDEVWHLHLIYTRSYQEMCEIIGRFIHHGPTKGGEKEDDRYIAQYNNTLSLYRFHFGEPPCDIWPSSEERFSPQRYVRVDLLKHYIVPVGDKKTLLKLLLKR